jgi:hypothetical protein
MQVIGVAREPGFEPVRGVAAHTSD